MNHFASIIALLMLSTSLYSMEYAQGNKILNTFISPSDKNPVIVWGKDVSSPLALLMVLASDRSHPFANTKIVLVDNQNNLICTCQAKELIFEQHNPRLILGTDLSAEEKIFVLEQQHKPLPKDVRKRITDGIQHKDIYDALFEKKWVFVPPACLKDNTNTSGIIIVGTANKQQVYNLLLTFKGLKT